MKKWFIFSAALLFAVSACKEGGDDKTKDSVSVNPSEKTFDSFGGTVDVTVTSSGTWTLTGESDLVTPSSRSGKTGAIVKFTAAPNTTDAPKEATFTFTVGKATDTFIVTVDEFDPTAYSLDLVSEDPVELTVLGGAFGIGLTTDLPASMLTTQFSDGGETWISARPSSEADGVVTLNFFASGNSDITERSTVLTISGAGKSVTVNITQATTPSLSTDKSAYYIDMAGGSVDVAVTCNVDYTHDFTNNAWLSVIPKAGVDDVYTFTAGAATGTRSATIKFESEDGEVSQTITITQTIITTAFDMTNQRLFPLAWANAAPLTDMKEFTIEALLCAEQWKGGETISNDLNTILGIEGRFLLRTGDGKPNNKLEIVYNNNSGTNEQKINKSGDVAGMIFENANQWYHLAVTYSQTDKTIKCYINGALVNTTTDAVGLPGVTFGLTPHNEDWNTTSNPTRNNRCFWIGYAFGDSRYWPGMMSEVRIWNKVLTDTDINATNHFYKVATNASGLVAYWKMDDNKAGTATTYVSRDRPDDTGNPYVERTIHVGVVKDYTSNGNDLSSWNPASWRNVIVPAPVQ